MAETTHQDMYQDEDADPLSLGNGLSVDVSGPFTDYLDLDLAALLNAVFAAAGGRYSRTEMSLTLADDDTVHALNRDWRGKDKPTNVLSFPGDDEDFPVEDVASAPPRHLGDVIVALETVQREAAEAGKTVSNHLAHLIVHGTLHLMGYDHLTDDEAIVMEALETRLLADFGIADPYQPIDA